MKVGVIWTAACQQNQSRNSPDDSPEMMSETAAQTPLPTRAGGKDYRS